MKRRGDDDAIKGLDPDMARALDRSLFPPQDGDGGLLARVKARVLAAIEPQQAPELLTVRKDSGGWETLGPGVERKRLWKSGDAASCLLRLAPGASISGHAHAVDEECVVLEGTVRIGDLVLHAGDFHVASQGSVHDFATTDSGALVYLRGAA